MNIELIQKTLHDLGLTLQVLSEKEYTQALQTLSGSSIGEHSRHIIEFFQELLNGYSPGLVHYDGRQRNALIQNDPQHAIQQLHHIADQIHLANKDLQLKTCLNQHETAFESNYYRELCYCWEHCIHHQALIKVGFIELNKTPLDVSFGVAVSTIAYRNQCAQ